MHLEFSWVDFGTSSRETEFLMTGTAMSINNTVLVDQGKKREGGQLRLAYLIEKLRNLVDIINRG